METLNPSDTIPTLPALRSLGNLASVRPVIVIDTREQCPLPFARLVVERGTLASGDYSFRGGEELFAVERKSVADLTACCQGSNRERFERELHRLRGFRFKRLLVVGSREAIERGEYVSRIAPKAVLATLAALEARFDVPVVFVPSPEDAGRIIESWAFWFARELVENVNTLARAAPPDPALRAGIKAMEYSRILPDCP
jgi:DNA excision repair protein ERCC-4